MESFREFWSSLDREERERRVAAFRSEDVLRAIDAEELGPDDFLALLSPAAAPHLEDMAQRAREVTTRQFGRAVNIFTPLYVSDVCTNHCRYCGFNAKNGQKRTHLSVDEAYQEAMAVAREGFQDILLLTGDAPRLSGAPYVAELVRRIRGDFACVGIEIPSQTEEDYRLLAEAGVTGMTMFQETYEPVLYAWLHPRGPKSDYAWRLEAPERAARGGMRSLGVGALLGLDRMEHDGFATGMHAWWLQRRFPGVDLGVSIPRICAHEGSFAIPHELDDRRFVQYVCALRLFLPRAVITCSSREGSAMRNALVSICVNRVSAGVSTGVGGRSQPKGEAPQFEISDERSLPRMLADLEALGFQGVVKDWEDPRARELSA